MLKIIYLFRNLTYPENATNENSSRIEYNFCGGLYDKVQGETKMSVVKVLENGTTLILSNTSNNKFSMEKNVLENNVDELTLRFPEGNLCNETKKYTVSFKIKCDKTLEKKNLELDDESISENKCDYTYTGRSPLVCEQKYYFVVTKTFTDYNYVFSTLMIVGGLFLCFLASRFAYVTIFLICPLSVMIFLSNCVFGFATIQSIWAFLGVLIGSLVLGLILALYIIIKEKKNVFGPILGGTVGFVATGICYNILLKYIYSNAVVVYWLTMLVCVIGLAIFGNELYDYFIIIGTSSVGAYGIIRGLGFIFHKFLSESIILELIDQGENAELEEMNSYFVYLYILGFIILLGLGAFIQYKFFKRDGENNPHYQKV